MCDNLSSEDMGETALCYQTVDDNNWSREASMRNKYKKAATGGKGTHKLISKALHGKHGRIHL